MLIYADMWRSSVFIIAHEASPRKRLRAQELHLIEVLDVDIDEVRTAEMTLSQL